MNEQILLLSIVTASIAFTISESYIFSGIREYIKLKNNVLGHLFSCGYCLSHWIALLLVLIYQPKLFDFYWIIDYFLTILVISWISAFQWILLCLLMTYSNK